MRTVCQTWLVAALAATWLAGQNVGIGTTTPITRLHVAAGDVFLGDAAGNDGFVLHSRSGNGYDYFQISTRTGGTYEWAKGITLVRSSGYVGIGTTAPVGPLHIATVVDAGLDSPADAASLVIGPYSAKHLELDDNEIHAMDGLVASTLYLQADGGDLYVHSDASVVGTEFIVKHNGNVGIGTAFPSQKLDVVGNVQFSGALMPAGNAGNTGQVLVSQGAGNAPQWQDLSTLTGFWKLLHVDAWNPNVNGSLGWSCTNCDGGPPYLTTCGTVTMLGGYNMCGNGCYFEKTFTGLPTHTEVMVEVFWWSIDSWDHYTNNIDLVSLNLDGTEVARATPYGPLTNSVFVRSTNASICGSNTSINVDIGPQVLVGWAAHTAQNVTVRITNLVNSPSYDESMGIVMVRVWVK